MDFSQEEHTRRFSAAWYLLGGWFCLQFFLTAAASVRNWKRAHNAAALRLHLYRAPRGISRLWEFPASAFAAIAIGAILSGIGLSILQKREEPEVQPWSAVEADHVAARAIFGFVGFFVWEGLAFYPRIPIPAEFRYLAAGLAAASFIAAIVSMPFGTGGDSDVLRYFRISPIVLPSALVGIGAVAGFYPIFSHAQQALFSASTPLHSYGFPDSVGAVLVAADVSALCFGLLLPSLKGVLKTPAWAIPMAITAGALVQSHSIMTVGSLAIAAWCTERSKSAIPAILVMASASLHPVWYNALNRWMH